MNHARELWIRYESIHAVVYFHPAALATFEGAGLRGFWRGYFAQRSAPLGAVGEAPVRAAFFGFSRAMTARALPAVWDVVSPADALTLRLDAATAALGELLGAGPDGAGSADASRATAGPSGSTGVLDPDAERAADDLWDLAVALPGEGRVLGAANAVLPRPEHPVQRLWQAATTFREHRGDGHVAALVAAGLGGLETLVLRGAHDLDADRLKQVRGWTDDEWDAATARLAGRGLLGTDAGRDLLADVEATTDRIAWEGWLHAGGTEDDARRIAAALQRTAETARGVLPDVNPIGVPKL